MDKTSNSESCVMVAGGSGMVGGAIVRQLIAEGFTNILRPNSEDLDLINQEQVNTYFEKYKPEIIYLAAAKVGGIRANNFQRAEFIYQNLVIQANVIHAAWRNGVSKLCFLGSSCIYPKHADQPIRENELLTGPLEDTNEPYAIAKIAGVKLCESYNRQYGTDYRCLMPTNLYGVGDNYNLENSHVVPALIRRFHEAKINGLESVTVWGSGSPRREFLNVDDLAKACTKVMEISKTAFQNIVDPDCCHINVGTGFEISIKDLANIVKETTGYIGEIEFDSTKPDGTPRKLLDCKRIQSLGWYPEIDFRSGLRSAYEDWLSRIAE